jgi:hypothetical protein
LTVIPVPENEAAAPDLNPVPVSVTFWALAPVASALGLAEVTVGPVLTVSAEGSVAVKLSRWRR